MESYLIFVSGQNFVSASLVVFRVGLRAILAHLMGTAGDTYTFHKSYHGFYKTNYAILVSQSESKSLILYFSDWLLSVTTVWYGKIFAKQIIRNWILALKYHLAFSHYSHAKNKLGCTNAKLQNILDPNNLYLTALGTGDFERFSSASFFGSGLSDFGWF